MPLCDFLSRWRLDAVGFLYHAMSAAGDLMVLFDERRPDHWALFDVAYAIAPVGRPMPPFLSPVERLGRFVLHEAPRSARFAVGRAAFALPAEPPAAVYEGASAWLASDLPARELRGRLGGRGGVAGLPRWWPGEPLPALDRTLLPPGAVRRLARRAATDDRRDRLRRRFRPHRRRCPTTLPARSPSATSPRCATCCAVMC